METIRSQMTTPVININSEATAQEAAQLMKEKGIGSLLVKGCEGYVGILAERDLVYKLVSEGMDPKTTPISKIMEDSILSIAPSASPADASSLMKEYKISHLAVMEGDDVAGILSIKDLIYHQ
ncbi:MAG: CBS domain-containing protein [Nitrospinaceae bacterium]|nr:CBS domain-containing protein [Nitrospinaceae bacterium]MBT5868462.1 CBS domain-containing protein [Nitrospinaceae bacterium]MBT6345245.1 CBS domain-containing protein [Nitrospina sp.]